jgi:hypothetical protein
MIKSRSLCAAAIDRNPFVAAVGAAPAGGTSPTTAGAASTAAGTATTGAATGGSAATGGTISTAGTATGVAGSATGSSRVGVLFCFSFLALPSLGGVIAAAAAGRLLLV